MLRASDWSLISFNSPFPKHFPTILFWVPFYLNCYILGGFLFIPCCGFLGPEIMQDSESPVLRPPGKATIYIYDKNIANKIHKKCRGCHISDPGGHPRWMPTRKCNEQPGELAFQGYCFYMPSASQKQSSRGVFSSASTSIRNIRLQCTWFAVANVSTFLWAFSLGFYDISFTPGGDLLSSQ